MTLPEPIKKIADIHIPIKHIVAGIIVLLIVCYFFKEQIFFEDLLKMLVPFLLGASVKIAKHITKNLIC